MAETTPTWGYRRAQDGEIESRLFPDGLPESGWSDSPASVDEIAQPKRRGRPRKEA